VIISDKQGVDVAGLVGQTRMHMLESS